MTALSWQALFDIVCAAGARPGADLCAVAAADSESGRDPRAVGDAGASLGLWQINDIHGLSSEVRFDPVQAAAWIVPQFGANYTEGIRRGYSGEQLVRWTCMATERPFGWGGPGAPGLDSPAADRYAASWHAAVAALTQPDVEPALHFDPDTPDEFQLQNWTCSVRTATWCLKSLGLDVTAGDMQDQMVAAGLVTPTAGLLDGSGTALAAWLTATFPVTATAVYPANLTDVQAVAGTNPIGLGGATWNHWVAVRRAQAGGLSIMNPAPGYHDVAQTLSPTQWQALGPFAALYVVPAGGADVDCSEYINLLGYLQGDVADALEQAITAAKTARLKADRDAKLDAALAAVQTLRNEGKT